MGDQAQPVGAAAEQQAEGDDDGRVPPQAQEPLQADPRAEDGQRGEGREAERGEERVAAVGQSIPPQISSCFGTRVRQREPVFVTSATSSIRTPPRPR